MFLILPEMAAIMIRAAMSGKTQTQIEPMPIRRNRPVASKSALAFIQEAAVDKPMIPSAQLPSGKPEVSDRFLFARGEKADTYQHRYEKHEEYQE